MKTNVKVIGYGLLVMGMLIMGMPTIAQQQDWRSTSTMQVSGSVYTPQVNEVGATNVTSMATTTTDVYSSSNTSGRHGARKSWDTGGNPEPGKTGDDGSPIGDAVLPLMLMAMLFAGVVYTRRKKALNR